MGKDFTDRLVASLTSNGKSQFEHFDPMCGGLLLRVTKTGNKTWGFTFTSPVDGKRGRLKIGPYPGVGLAKARELARAAQEKIAEGKDPREPEASNRTMDELIEERLALTLRGKKRSADEVERRLAKYVTPVVGRVSARDFRIDPHYNAIVDPLIKRGRTRSAGVLFQDLRALFNFAIQRGYIEYSRLARIKRPDVYVERTRFLTRDEIFKVWHGLPAVLTRSTHTSTILRLCLVTGQRVGEVTGMHRDEIDLANRIWTIPAARSKNKFEHAVPLTPLALELLRDAMQKSNYPHLFADRSGEGPIAHTVIDYAVRKSQQPRKGMPNGKFDMPRWTPHDLRRTVATWMSRRDGLGISDVIIGHVLNHRTTTRASITARVYVQNDFIEEKRDALTRWDSFLLELVSDTKIETALAAE